MHNATFRSRRNNYIYEMSADERHRNVVFAKIFLKLRLAVEALSIWRIMLEANLYWS